MKATEAKVQCANHQKMSVTYVMDFGAGDGDLELHFGDMGSPVRKRYGWGNFLAPAASSCRQEQHKKKGTYKWSKI
jgi:hypothetical protein